MLEDEQAGGIDYHQFVVENGRNRRQQPVPVPCLAPAHEPVAAGGRGAV